jgi:predicted amidophosphoribosyltransferase
MSMRNKIKKEIVKVESDSKNEDTKKEKDNLFNKTANLEKKTVSYTIPKPLANLLDEYKFKEKIDKSEVVTKALLNHLPEKYLKKYIK